MDSLSISFIVSELSHLIVPSQIRKIYEMSGTDYLLNLWAGNEYWLLISLEGESRRLHLISQKTSHSRVPSSFCMFLRKHMQGLYIKKIEQPLLERVVYFHIGSRKSDKDKEMIVELFGRTGNIILLDKDGRIMRSLLPVPQARKTGDRSYSLPPPPANKKDPFSVNSYALFSQSIENLKGLPEDVLAKIFLGLTKEYTQEIVYAANIAEEKRLEEFTDDERASLFNSWKRFWTRVREKRINPVMIQKDDSPISWGLWLYRDQATSSYREYPSLNKLLQDFYSNKQSKDSLERQRKRHLEDIKNRLTKAERKYHAIIRDLENAEESMSKREIGELILMHKQAIAKGMESIQVENVFADPPKIITIPLDPLLSAAENAQKLFERYKKSRRAVSILKTRRDEVIRDIEHWRKLMIQIHETDDPRTLDQLNKKLSSTQPVKAEKLPISSGPRRFTYKNYEFLVGRNPLENDELTFKIAKPEDLWFHVRHMGGAHVVLKMPGKKDDSVPHDVLEKGAALAAYYSKGKKSPKVPVDFTRAKYVKKTRHLKQGMVLIDREKTLIVNPLDEEFQEWIRNQGH